MKKPTAKFLFTLTTGIVIGVAGTGVLNAQQSGVQRTLLLKNDLSVPGHEAIIGRAEIPAGLASGRHSHHGEEVGYVLAGEMTLEVDGKPPQTLKAGDAYFIEAGKIHNATTLGSAQAKVVAVYIVDKGKALAVPAP